MFKMLCHIHTYPPNACSGADIYAERLNTYLANKGCEVRVIIDNCSQPYQYKNHSVASNKNLIAENYEWADVIITHLVARNQAVFLAERFNKPIFHVCHNATISTLDPGKPKNYIIYNSYWLQKERPLLFPSIVVQPPTFPEDWKIDRSRAEYITLVNLTANKGAQLFHQMALSLPQFKFIGVLGGYGQQNMKPISNITYKRFGTDMQEVYDMTKILVVPSKTESWSLVAAEAQCCGIPVICSDLPGLRENLGYSGIYANGLREYVDRITELMNNETFYYLGRIDTLQNAESKNHKQQLDNLYNFMQEAIEPKEKIEVPVIKEKVEIEPVKEKKEIRKPGRPKKIKV